MLTTLPFTGYFARAEVAAGLWPVPGFLLGHLLSQPLALRIDGAIARAAVLVVSGGIAVVARGI
jgi:hypothetical protein